MSKGQVIGKEAKEGSGGSPEQKKERRPKTEPEAEEERLRIVNAPSGGRVGGGPSR